ncbi:MAG: hypothetical protein RR558_11080, partial [Coprobacillus sp.]
MKKVIGIMMPYIIIGFVLLMNSISLEYRDLLTSLVVGILIAIWILSVSKCVGTLNMKILSGVSCFVLTVFLVVILLIDHIILQYLSTTIALLVPLHYACYYILIKNKPQLHMSYQYSYKNKKRRY